MGLSPLPFLSFESSLGPSWFGLFCVFQQGFGHLDHMHQCHGQFPWATFLMGSGGVGRGGSAAEQGDGIGHDFFAADILVQGPDLVLDGRHRLGGIEVIIERAPGSITLAFCNGLFRGFHPDTYVCQ